MRLWRGLTLYVVVGALALLPACGSDSAGASPPSEPKLVPAEYRSPAVPKGTGAVASSDAPSSSPFRAAAAEADPIVLHESPGGPEVMRLPKMNDEGGIPFVFRVIGDADGWHRVMLPTRPNGSTAWVRSADVTVYGVRHKVVVHLESLTVELFDGPNLIDTWPAGIGKDNYPTPTGSYYVLERWQVDPESAYGPWALGISAHSDVLDDFGGGDGRVAIHGTNHPEYLPGKVSHGCVRLHNDQITALSDRIELGAPVEILER